MTSILVKKADGTEEQFIPEKLLVSLRRAGATDSTAAEILRQVEQSLQSGMTTSEIYKSAFKQLRDRSRGAAVRYSMKRALLELGPSGFPFEEFVAEIYRAQGLAVTTNTILAGACVEHEIDVLIEGGKKRTVIEAKFHNALGFKTDLKVALYVAARIEDVRRGVHADEIPIEGMLLTNTKFTSKAIQYGTCARLELVSWDYPREGNLNQLIDRSGVFPVTALTTLSRREKIELMNQNIVLCKAVLNSEPLLQGIGLKQKRIGEVFSEVGTLCGAS